MPGKEPSAKSPTMYMIMYSLSIFYDVPHWSSEGWSNVDDPTMWPLSNQNTPTLVDMETVMEGESK